MDRGNSIRDFFSDLTEPRESNKRHKLIDIITIALCVVIYLGGYRGIRSYKDSVVRDVPRTPSRHSRPRHLCPGLCEHGTERVPPGLSRMGEVHTIDHERGYCS